MEIESLLVEICANLKVVIYFTYPVEQRNVLSIGIFVISEKGCIRLSNALRRSKQIIICQNVFHDIF